MSNKQKDGIDNKSASPTSQQTPGPKEEVVGRVNNESDENAGLETPSHVEEIGVVSNKKKTIRTIGKHRYLARGSLPAFLTSCNKTFGLG